MLFILSDLHFVDGSAGDHNLPAAAYKKALTTVGVDIDDISGTKERFARCKISELQVLFLGDIFDAFRSCNWLDTVAGVPDHVRPWGSDVSGIDHKHVDTLCKTREILRQILPSEAGGADDSALLAVTDRQSRAKVADVCRLFRNLKTGLMSGDKALSVKYSYIPGNHDRFMRVDPESRKLARAALALDDDPVAGFDTCFQSRDYNVVAVHGNEFDMFNFGRGIWEERAFDRDAWGEPSFGEAMTILACKIVDTLARELGGRSSAKWRELKTSVENIDNIRPVLAVFPYLRQVIHRKEFSSLLDEVVRKLFDELTDGSSRFVRSWSDRIAGRHISAMMRVGMFFLLGFKTATLANVLRKIDKFSEKGFSGELLKNVLGSTKTSEERVDSVLKSEFYEKKLGGLLQQMASQGGTANLVYGHTHAPEIVPIWGHSPKTLLFNTGTFRPRISACGHPESDREYITHKTISFAVFYRKGERSSDGREKKHEFWHAVLSEIS